jgi:hypothetical protein
MGNSRFDANDWSNYSTSNFSGKSTTQIFTAKKMAKSLNPLNIKVREARDSVANPYSTPLILGSDVTGSMGMIAHKLITDGVPTVAKEIYTRKPISDPQIMMMAIGDARGGWSDDDGDASPLQTTQFEADALTLLGQVKDLHVEGGGNGNGGEGYSLAHYFASNRVVSDSWEKRRKKGYIFTIGDEPCHLVNRASELERVFGGKFERDYTAEEIADAALRTFEVFHVVLVNEGYCRSSRKEVLDNWNRVLPQRIIQLEDLSMLAETIVSTIQVVEGASKATVASSWGDKNALVIANAIKDVAARSGQSGAMRLA